jgi:hypothetical protein
VIGPGVVLGPELERVVTVAPFGFRLWDPVVGRAVTDGLDVVCRLPGGRRVAGSASPSGVFSLRNMPGFAAFEHGAGDVGFWASPPPAPPIGTVEVSDRLGRYLPFSFGPDAPARIGQQAREVCGAPAGGVLGLSDASPPEPSMPVLPLFSAASRATPQGMARLSAQLESTAGTPLAGAMVRVDPPGDHPWYGLADARGSVTVLFPYPKPPGDVPDLCEVLSQLDEAPLPVDAGGSPATDLTEVRLDYGVPLDVRTVPLSVLIVEAGSPPSS